MFGNWNNFFNDDFGSFQIPSFFDPGVETNNLRQKRKAQNKVNEYKNNLQESLNDGNIELASQYAKDLAQAKSDLLKLGRSASSEEIAQDADQTMKYAEEQIEQHKQQTKSEPDQEEEIEQSHPSTRASRRHKKRKAKKNAESNQIKIDEEEIKNDNNEHEKDENGDISVNDVPINEQKKELNEQIAVQSEEAESKAMDGIKKICDETKEAIKKSQEFEQRSKDLVKQLEEFRKDFYDIDATIMTAVLKLDDVNVSNNNNAKEMRKKVIAYYMEILKKLDQNVQPLNNLHLNFKTRV